MNYLENFIDEMQYFIKNIQELDKKGNVKKKGFKTEDHLHEIFASLIALARFLNRFKLFSEIKR